MMLRKEEHFELPKQREISRAVPAQLPKQSQQKQIEEKNKLLEAIKSREKQKEKERQKIFEAFGKEGEAQKISKPEAKSGKKGKNENNEIKTQKPIKPQKFKEDAFIKLREITKESKKKKQSHKNAGK